MKAEHATTTRQEQQLIQRNAAAQRAQQSQASQASGADLFAQMLQDNLDPGKDTATPGALTAAGDTPLLEDPTLAGLVPPQAKDARKSTEDPANAAGLFNPLAGLQIGLPSEAITTEDQAVNAALARAQDTAPGQFAGKGLANRPDKGGKPQHPNVALPATPAVPASADDALGRATPATPADPGAQGLQLAAQALLQGGGNAESTGTHRMGSNGQGSDATQTQPLTVTIAESAPSRGESNSPSNGSGSDLGTGATASQESSTTATTTTETAPPESFAERMDQAMQEAFESLGAQVSVWASQNTKRAAMRLDAGLRDALEVDVTLKDRQAHIHFRTDDAQAREAIRAQAQTILSDLLARQGMDLGSVSVGAQGGDSNGRSSGQPESSQGWRGLHRALDRVGGSETAEQAVQIRPRSQRALDLYA